MLFLFIYNIYSHLKANIFNIELYAIDYVIKDIWTNNHNRGYKE